MSDSRPLTLGMFNLLVAGSDCLTSAIAHSLDAAGLGAEVYPESAHDLALLQAQRPGGREAPFTAHLPRELNILEAADRETVVQFAKAADDSCRGFTIHDQAAMYYDPAEYAHSLKLLAEQLTLSGGPTAFIEFSGALGVADFVHFFEKLPFSESLGACIDIGHMASRVATEHFAANYPAMPIWRLSEATPGILQMLDDVEAATQAARPKTVDAIRRLARTPHPLHFHLHDGNPLLKNGPYGLCDHHMFRSHYTILFQDGIARELPPFFGPEGLEEIISVALHDADPETRSFLLEIHPTYQRARPPEHEFERWECHSETVKHMCYCWVKQTCKCARLLHAAIESAYGTSEEAGAAAS